MIKQMYQISPIMIAIAQGIPFYHAGQEMYRIKFGVENSYNQRMTLTITGILIVVLQT